MTQKLVAAVFFDEEFNNNYAYFLVAKTKEDSWIEILEIGKTFFFAACFYGLKSFGSATNRLTAMSRQNQAR